MNDAFWDWIADHFGWRWADVPYMPRENITETCHRLRIPPPSKL